MLSLVYWSTWSASRSCWQKNHPSFSCTSCKQRVMCSSLHSRVVSVSECMKLLLHCLLFLLSKLLYGCSTCLFKKIMVNFGERFEQRGESARRVACGVMRILHQEYFSGFPLIGNCLSRFSSPQSHRLSCWKKKSPAKQPYSLNWTETKYSEDGYE